MEQCVRGKYCVANNEKLQLCETDLLMKTHLRPPNRRHIHAPLAVQCSCIIHG